MTALPAKDRMTVDEFLVWAQSQPRRYELVDGRPVAMSPERARHAETKGAVFMALVAAIRRAELGCYAMTDGMTVRVDEETAYEPDALVYCGEKISGDATIVEAPVIIVEVASPSTEDVDAGAKLEGYFRVPSVMQYLILDPVHRVIIHHARQEVDIRTRIIRSGAVRLDPPGIAFDLGEAFG